MNIHFQEFDNGEYLTDVFIAISSFITTKNASSTEPAVEKLFGNFISFYFLTNLLDYSVDSAPSA